jgi:2-C-methyl-D-erythritol 4-phosphate cytidylyltransferase
MNDPVTNALALQLEFGDDALRQEIEARITDIVKREILRMLHDPEIFRRLVVNNAYDFENAVARSMKNFLNSPRNTY